MPKPKHMLPLLLFAVLLVPAMGQAQPVAEREAFIDALLVQMTLEEKLGQLAQYRGRWSDTGPRVPEGGEAEIRAGIVGSFLGVHGAAYTREMQRIAVEESRLGIPLLFAHDVIHGFRTIFPVPLAETATWNPNLARESARWAAREAAAHGLHWTFAPMVDIARDGRWGRIVEGAGEDPVLGSVMAAVRVEGFQGDDLSADYTLLACAKHFVAYGAAEGGRDYNVADLSERTLREIFLPPFKAAVDAGAATVMAAFNEVNGVPMHAHDELIDGVLRAEWGWDGLVVSDYTGIMELLHHGVAADSAHAGRLGLEAGVDVDMVSGIYLRKLPEEVRAGRLAMDVVDESVRRILRLKYDLGLFDDPYRYSDPQRERERTLTPEMRAFAREIGRESIVLLKNKNRTLPLSKNTARIAVIGPLAQDQRSAIGNWAAAGRAEEAVSVLDGIRAAVPNATVRFAQGVPDVRSVDTAGFGEAVELAQESDVAILVLGETQDMSAEANNRTSLDLPGVQRELAQAIHATGTPVVVLLMNGRPLSIPWLDENVPAILETWYLGSEMGPAVADVLFGDYNPSGKLPVTFPRTVGQVPIYYNYKNTGRPPSEQNKYTSKYIDVPWTPLYPFGYGLSYTTFAYSEPQLSSTIVRPGEEVTVSVTVTNTGDVTGEEVVQLYLQDEVASITRPVKELRQFEKIHLAPAAAQTITFTLTPSDLAFYGPTMERIIEPGFFKVFVGGNSRDVQEARFEWRDE